jgi:hypothetical protein
VKKVAAVLLLFLLVAPFWIVFFSLHAKKEMVRREVKHRLMDSEPEEAFVHMAFTTKEAESLLRWEHSREFEYLGEMYDVVRTKTRNDSVFYTLWWDHEETDLNQKLAALTKSLQGDSAPANEARLIDAFKVFPPTASPIAPQTIGMSQTKEFYYDNTFRNIYLSVESPPPEHLIS